MDKVKFLLIFLIGFAVYFWIDSQYFSLLQKEITRFVNSRAAGHILTYSVTLIPLLVTVAVAQGTYKTLLYEFGLSCGFMIGAGFAFLCTLPMLLGYGILFSLNRELSFDSIVIMTVSSAFFEEVIFRAFLFGQLYRHTRLGFLPAVLGGSLLFGSAHLYQGTETSELAGIFAITFVGSILFSWIYAEWKFNLWTAILLHFLMNLYWLIFDVDSNALGDTYANVFRFSTVFLAVIATIFYKYRKKVLLEIGIRTLFISRAKPGPVKGKAEKWL